MKIWKSLGERRGQLPKPSDEFPEELPVGEGARKINRRDFFRFGGLGLAVSLAVGCDSRKGSKALALLRSKEGFVPGTDLWYATTCPGCSAGCGVLAKCRDGRPIKLEGNPSSPVGHGALCAVGQAQLRDLYDAERLREPRMGGPCAWEALDRDLGGRWATLKATGGRVAVLSSTVTSPTLLAAIARFLAPFPAGRHITYDALSCAALPAAYERTHGQRVMPSFHLEEADLLVAVEADFLGAWLNPAGFGRAYASRRGTLPRPMSRHIQVESGLSLTGSNADQRVRVAPSEAPAFLEHLTAAVERLAGAETFAPLRAAEAAPRARELARELWSKRGASLVLCGLNDLEAQVFTARLNHLLGNEGRTLDLARPSLQKQGDDPALRALVKDMAEGRVDALVVLDANPVYDLPGFQAALAKVPCRVALNRRDDETGCLCTHQAPDHHPLETWRDALPFAGTWSLVQPLVRPLFNTRDAAESLALWAGAPTPTGAQDQVRETWRTQVHPHAPGLSTFDGFWREALLAGSVILPPAGKAPAYREDRKRSQAAWSALPQPKPAEFELLLYAKPALLDGRHAGNALLQELPDPITKTTWDNYVQISPASAGRHRLKQGDLVRLRHPGLADLVLPVLVQPGLHDRTLAVALGYGRTRAGKVGTGVGQNAFPWVEDAGFAGYQGRTVELSPTPMAMELACTQDHHRMEGRELVREMECAAFLKDPASARSLDPQAPPSLYVPHAPGKHTWVMVIDLSKCSGCSACVISCQAENNTAVVGKDEVRRHREMHWLRIDRYYTGTEEDPGVVHQPMMCQQCGNAPCENVCPVLATVHSDEGLNEQVYNRCVGTRYCANNCPYKTRRFNWFENERRDEVANLALNPDVTVRSRGVMEKCSFCVQRIQCAKAKAKDEGRPSRDGEIKTACQQSCPGMAILFGDLNDPDSEVHKAMADPRRYAVLGELGVLPSVSYFTRLRNAGETGGHHE